VRITPADKAEYDRQKAVRRYVGDPKLNRAGDLYAFCVERLGYTHLSEKFHGPMAAEMDKQDLKRFRQWEGHQQYKEPLDDLTEAAREHIKTSLERGRVIRY